jgi:hypothetical protein
VFIQYLLHLNLTAMEQKTGWEDAISPAPVADRDVVLWYAIEKGMYLEPATP